MLFIFRKIRRSFFLPGKVRTYMAYAAGEIVLIVIGIMIALQINDWNQQRKNTDEEQQLLALISDAMASYIFLIERGYQLQEEGIAASERLVTTMKNPSVPSNTEQLDRDLYTITHNRWMIGAGTTTHIYDALIGGGKLGLISSEDLKTGLRNVKEDFGYFHGYESAKESFVDNQLSPFLKQYIDRLSVSEGNLQIDPALYDSPFTTDYEALLKSREFSNLLSELIMHMNSNLDNYKRAYNRISKIDALVIKGNPLLEPREFNREDLLN